MPVIPQQRPALSGAAPRGLTMDVPNVAPGIVFGLAEQLSQQADRQARQTFDEAQVEFQTRLNNELAKALQAEDANGLVEGFTQTMTTHRDELAQGIDPAYASQFTGRAGLSIAANTGSVINHAMKLEDRRFTSLFEGHVEQQEIALRQDPSPARLAAAQLAVTEQARAYEGTNVWDQPRMEAELRPAIQRLQLSLADALLRQDRYGEVMHIAANGGFNGLEERQYDAVVSAAISGVQAETYYSLGEAIEQARLSGDPNAFFVPGFGPSGQSEPVPIEDAISTAHATSLLSRGQAFELRRQLGYAMQSMVKEAQFQERAALILAGHGNPADPDDKKVVEELASRMGEDLDAHIELVGQSGMVADTTTRLASHKLETGTLEEAAQVYLLIHRVNESVPGKYPFGGSDAEKVALSETFARVEGRVLDPPIAETPGDPEGYVVVPEAAARFQQTYRNRLDELSGRPSLTAQARKEQKELWEAQDGTRELATLLAPGSGSWERLSPQMTLGLDTAELEDNEEFLANANARMTDSQRSVYNELQVRNPRAAATYAMLAQQPEVVASFDLAVQQHLTEGDAKLTLAEATRLASIDVSRNWWFHDIDGFPRLMKLPIELDRGEVGRQFVDWTTRNAVKGGAERIEGFFGLLRAYYSLPSKALAEFVDFSDFLSQVPERAMVYLTGEAKPGIDPEHPWSYDELNSIVSEGFDLQIDPDATPEKWRAHQARLDKYMERRPRWFDDLILLLRPDPIRASAFRLEPIGYHGTKVDFRVFLANRTTGELTPASINAEGREIPFTVDTERTLPALERARRKAYSTLEAVRDAIDEEIQQQSGLAALPGSNLPVAFQPQASRSFPRDMLREAVAGVLPGAGLEPPNQAVIPPTTNPLLQRLIGSPVGVASVDPKTGDTIATWGPQHGRRIFIRGEDLEADGRAVGDGFLQGHRMLTLDRERLNFDWINVNERVKQMRFWFATNVPALRFLTSKELLGQETRELEAQVGKATTALGRLRRREARPK